MEAPHFDTENLASYVSVLEENGNVQNMGEKVKSNATFLDVQDDREKDLFTFLVKECGGCISLKKLKEKMSPLPDDFDNWLSKEKKILAFYKKNDKIIYIIPFLNDATFCAHHINFVTRCEIENCDNFHVCKYYLNKHCSYGEKCRNGHTFTVGNNKKIKHKLGLNRFGDDEIRTILKSRYPQVCPADDCESDEPDECPFLHVCYMFTQDKCKYTLCYRGHSLDDPHNKWVLSVYEMEDWPEKRPELFKAVITLRRKLRRDSIEDEGSSKIYAREPASSFRSPSSEENEREEDSLIQGLVKQMKEEKQQEEENVEKTMEKKLE